MKETPLDRIWRLTKIAIETHNYQLIRIAGKIAYENNIFYCDNENTICINDDCIYYDTNTF